ncbi:hypothetical protein M758_12G044500 [Ceratodon purpureus]|nr:hypothetical protein M758_12G044500 [Ceratodon purpureus]
MRYTPPPENEAICPYLTYFMPTRHVTLVKQHFGKDIDTSIIESSHFQSSHFSWMVLLDLCNCYRLQAIIHQHCFLFSSWGRRSMRQCQQNQFTPNLGQLHSSPPFLLHAN